MSFRQSAPPEDLPLCKAIRSAGRSRRTRRPLRLVAGLAPRHADGVRASSNAQRRANPATETHRESFTWFGGLKTLGSDEELNTLKREFH